jgi:hypothetical protein
MIKKKNTEYVNISDAQRNLFWYRYQFVEIWNF